MSRLPAPRLLESPRCVWDAAAQLGEGTCWSEREQALWWVDILGRRLLRYAPASGERRSWGFDEFVSAVAEPLAHRAARELGPRGEQLLWKSWGRWRFKGVPGAQEVFEVGEAGLAPLRIPRNGPKAWRDIPLWRRPAALAAEAALLAGLAVGAWFGARNYTKRLNA